MPNRAWLQKGNSLFDREEGRGKREESERAIEQESGGRREKREERIEN